MREYNKIDTVFKRDMDGTKNLIEGEFRSKSVEYLKDNRWYFTEKIDGTNIRVYWDGHSVSFGGRTDRANIPSHLLETLKGMFGTNEAEEMFEQTFGEKEAILFGEGYGPKIQSGGLYRSDVSFILFDVMVGDVYLDRDAIESIAESFGIDIVPIVLVGTIQQAVDFVKTFPKSTIGTANMEGVVGKPMTELYEKNGKRVIVKIKACDFR